MRRQMPGRPDGANPLIYTGSVPNMITMPRRPTVIDGLNWPLGYWWVIPKDDTYLTGEIWILVSVANSIATWKKLHGGGGPTPPTNTLVINKSFIAATGSGTYTPTSGMIQCYVECVGGGGGSAGSNGALPVFLGGAGGGGGYCAKLFTAVQIGTSQSYSVGIGGAGGGTATPPGEPGNAGANTTFGSFLTAGGGSGGQIVSSGAGGSATGGDINIPGGPGMQFVTVSGGFGPSTSSSAGGSSILGFGGASLVTNGSGNNGGLYGGGASGPVNDASAAVAGSSGAQGIIIITEYIG